MEKEKAKTFFSRLSQFSVIVIVLITCAKDKVQPKAVGIIAGAVKTEYGQPLDGASIVVTTQEGILYGHTISGTYTVNSVPAGNCKIEVNKEGYLPGVATITVLAGQQTMQDFVLKHGVPYLNLNDSVINTGSQAGGLDEIVGSNASWHAESNDAWLSFDPGTVNGSGSLRISWLVLDSTISRVGSITLKSGPVSKQIKIYQESPVKLFSVKPIIGNYALGQYDSVEIVFSKPVEIVSLSSNWSACQSVMNYRGKNGTAITFSYSCASLGGTYPVSISVKDEKGYTFRFDSDVSFFTKKLTKGAGVTDFCN